MSNILRFDEEHLLASLRKLPPIRRTLFAAMVATRLAPSFQIYCSHSASAAQEIFCAGLDYLWSALSDGAGMGASAETDRQIELAMELIPSEDDVGPFVAQAEDAAAALAYALRSLNKSDPQEAAWAARRAYESADNLVVGRPGVEIGGHAEEHVLEDRLIQAELSRQLEDLENAVALPIDATYLDQARKNCLDWGGVFFGEALRSL